MSLRPDPGTYSISAARTCWCDFAARNGLAMRGHNSVLEPHAVDAALGRGARFRLPSGDGGGENAPRAHLQGLPPLRQAHLQLRRDQRNDQSRTPANWKTPSFTKHLGWNLIDICFHAAREAAPHAELVYNDFPSWGPERHASRGHAQAAGLHEEEEPARRYARHAGPYRVRQHRRRPRRRARRNGLAQVPRRRDRHGLRPRSSRNSTSTTRMRRATSPRATAPWPIWARRISTSC